MTYRAAIWTSADRQSEIVLTTPEDAELTTSELLAAAQREIESTGLQREDGDDLYVGEWSA